MNNTITIGIEYRPCFVDGEKALFHRWAEHSEIYAPSLLKGGHNGGVEKYVTAIVEYADGSIKEVMPNKIRFCTGKMNEYAFEE